MENKDLLRVAIASIHGNVEGNYSKGQTSEAIRNAIIEINGGNTKLNPKTFYRGNAVFDLVETLIPVMIEEGLKENNPLFDLVEYRNIAAGDENAFVTEGETNFVVADVAAGIQGVRRQRIGDGSTVSIKTSPKIVRVYENLGRLLAGRISWDKFVQGVTEAFNKQILNDAYKAVDGLTSATAGLSSTYVHNGSYSEDKLLELIDHVEAATGKSAKILGTRTALRKVNIGAEGETALTSKYNLGYYGSFSGTPMIRMMQAHKPGTSNFILNDNKLFIVASDDRPIKFVNEGDGWLSDKGAELNADLTQEYVYIQSWGTGAIAAAPLAIYTMA